MAGTFIENFESDPKAVIRNISNIYVHPNYEHKAAANDLAVLELNNTLEYYNTNITSAAISDQIPDYPECYVFGWGCNTNTTVSTYPFGRSFKKYLNGTIYSIYSRSFR